MSYDLFLTFDRSVRKEQLQSFFAGRSHYTNNGVEVIYNNPDTGVYFHVACEFKKSFLRREFVAKLSINVNYFRPSFFGLEVEPEITALVAAFQPAVEDPQMYGMGSGPYSPEGFLRGWNYGNQFGAQAFLSHEGAMLPPSLPAAKLRESWVWNYSRGVRQAKLGESQFIPLVLYFDMAGEARTVAVWPEGLPAILPVVDMLLIGRMGEDATGDPRRVMCLAPWRVVADVLARAGFIEKDNALDLHYERPPQIIIDFVESLPETDLATLTRLSPDKIVDQELLKGEALSLR